MPLDIAPDQLLRWYLEAGVDETIGEQPVDRFAAHAQARAAAAAPRPQPGPAAPAAEARAAAAHVLPAHHHPAVPGQHAATASHVASACTTLEELRVALSGFDGLPLKASCTSTVFADGNPQAEVMVIGEAPGQEEDKQGLPFVGPSGRLLDRMLASIGLDRGSVYITNVLPWRPPANRKPTPDEVAVCLPFVTRHIELVDPKMLLLFGGAAASAILARHEGIGRLRGQWFTFSSPGLPRPIPALATFHPAYLMRTPEAKREAWRDLLMVKKRLDGR